MEQRVAIQTIPGEPCPLRDFISELRARYEPHPIPPELMGPDQTGQEPAHVHVRHTDRWEQWEGWDV